MDRKQKKATINSFLSLFLKTLLPSSFWVESEFWLEQEVCPLRAIGALFSQLYEGH